MSTPEEKRPTCRRCFRPEASQEDWDTVVGGGRPDLCWGSGYRCEDRRDERISAQESEIKRLWEAITEHTGYQPGVPVTRYRPTHGNCCTCQGCGHPHDECMCDHNAFAALLNPQEPTNE